MARFEEKHWKRFIELAPQYSCLSDIVCALSKEFNMPLTRHDIKDYVHKVNGSGGNLRVPSEYLNKSTEKTKYIEEDTTKTDLLIENLKSKVNFYRNKYNGLLKQQNLTDLVLDTVKENIAVLSAPIIKKPKLIKDISDAEQATIVLSDLHIGEVVSKEEMAGINEYNINIFCKRLQFISDKILDIVFNKLSGYEIRTLNVFGIGDWVSGVIHQDTIESAEITIVEQAFTGAHIMSQFLSELSMHFDNINCHFVVGNHGRLSSKITYKHRYLNWDYVLYQTLALILTNHKNITFNIPKSFFLVTEIMDHKFLLTHGDNIKSWNNMPYYGIDKITREMSEILNGEFDYVVLGHFHSSATLPRVRGEIFVNGSMIGGNEFSIGALYKSAEPVQLLFGTHGRKGVSWRFPLKLRYADNVNVPIRYIY